MEFLEDLYRLHSVFYTLCSVCEGEKYVQLPQLDSKVFRCKKYLKSTISLKKINFSHMNKTSL